MWRYWIQIRGVFVTIFRKIDIIISRHWLWYSTCLHTICDIGPRVPFCRALKSLCFRSVKQNLSSLANGYDVICSITHYSSVIIIFHIYNCVLEYCDKFNFGSCFISIRLVWRDHALLYCIHSSDMLQRVLSLVAACSIKRQTKRIESSRSLDWRLRARQISVLNNSRTNFNPRGTLFNTH